MWYSTFYKKFHAQHFELDINSRPRPDILVIIMIKQGRVRELTFVTERNFATKNRHQKMKYSQVQKLGMIQKWKIRATYSMSFLIFSFPNFFYRYLQYAVYCSLNICYYIKLKPLKPIHWIHRLFSITNLNFILNSCKTVLLNLPHVSKIIKFEFFRKDKLNVKITACSFTKLFS